MSLCIKYKGKYFQFRDVVGDGNCLYSALSISAEINGNTGEEVRFVSIYRYFTSSSRLLFIFVVSLFKFVYRK